MLSPGAQERTGTESLSPEISLSGEETGIVIGPGWHDKDNLGRS